MNDPKLSFSHLHPSDDAVESEYQQLFQRLQQLQKKRPLNKVIADAVNCFQSSEFPPKVTSNNLNQIEDNQVTREEIKANISDIADTDDNNAENIETIEKTIHTSREANDFVRDFMEKHRFEMHVVDFVSSNYLISDDYLEELCLCIFFKHF